MLLVLRGKCRLLLVLRGRCRLLLVLRSRGAWLWHQALTHKSEEWRGATALRAVVIKASVRGGAVVTVKGLPSIPITPFPSPPPARDGWWPSTAHKVGGG